MGARSKKSASEAKKDRRSQPNRQEEWGDSDEDVEDVDTNDRGGEEGPPSPRRDCHIVDDSRKRDGAMRLTQVVVVAGTYDGVMAGWEFQKDGEEDESEALDNSSHVQLKIRFASPIHNGSVRCLALNTTRSASSSSSSTTTSAPSPGMLVSVGFDDVIKLHDFRRHETGRGEVRTPSEWGTPLVAALAPPASATHCLVGFVTGKILIYSTKDWTVQHVLPGHSSSTSSSSTSGVASLSVHPSGKLALSGGLNDGKLMLWDLTKGRLAHVNKVNTAASSSSSSSSKRRYEPIACIVWGQCGHREMYGYCHGNHVTVRDVATGKELLDVELPSKVHQICFLSTGPGVDGSGAAAASFVAAACDDGSLPVLAVDDLDAETTESEGTAAPVRRALMAIEPVETSATGRGAGEERFKCIQAVSPCHVVTANSAGVVSLMDLSGAIRMLLDPQEEDDDDEEEEYSTQNDSDDADGDDDDAEEGEEELAVDILDSVRLGSGARITCLTAWAATASLSATATTDKGRAENIVKPSKTVDPDPPTDFRPDSNAKRKRDEVELDATALEKARKLVAKAKKIQKRKRDKKKEGQAA